MNKTIIKQPQSVSCAFDELLNKMYISNVQNRLRQLNEPSENDCKRWIWELIQNAKDSISQEVDRKSVDIKLKISNKEVRFIHNGAPFSAKAQLGLLYKYSEGKSNNSESTGRFGTGFLTTHTLSKTVSIEGDVYTEDPNNPLCGFSATMYRDGLDESELLDGVRKMKESMIWTGESNGWTTYTYHLKTPQNEKALVLGLENFISNIAPTMLFCKELKNIELDNNGIITNIYREEPVLLSDDIWLSKFKINGKTTYFKQYIHKTFIKQNEELSKRYKSNRKVRLTLAIEIDDDNNIVENNDTPSHFCVLPLVGSEKHIMPIYINSPDFEPDSERESLILIGDEMLADKEVISDGGINRLILKDSISIFDSLVNYLTNNNYHKLFLLAKGLKETPKVDKNFDKDWFKEEITNPYRDILKKYNIVETSNGNKELFDSNNNPYIIIPKDGKSENQCKLYDLLIPIFGDRLPMPKVADNWASLAWKECGLFRIRDLCIYISEKKCVDNIQINTDKYKWLNDVLLFIKQNDESLFKEFSLIPNYNGDFISLNNNEFVQGIDITEYSLDILNLLGGDIRSDLLNKNIVNIELPVKIDNKIIAEKIKEKVDCIVKNQSSTNEEIFKKLLPLINTTPNDSSKYDIDFIGKQKNFQLFASNLFSNFEFKSIINNDIPEKAWYSLHKWLIKLMIGHVAECKNIASLPDRINNKLEWSNSFITFVSKYLKEGELDLFCIIPNQKGIFHLRKALSKDKEIPEEFKTERFEKFGIKLKDSLLDKNITSVNLEKEISIESVVNLINNIFKDNKFQDGEDSLDFAIFLLHFLPKESESILYKSQKALLDIVKTYYYNKSKNYFPITIVCNNEDFWLKANLKIASSLKTDIEKKGCVENLNIYLNGSDKTYDFGDTIIFLNNVYDFLKSRGIEILEEIIPNQKGQFCSFKKDFYKDEDIPEQLKDILALAAPDKDFRTLLAEKSLSIQPSNSKKILDITMVITDVVKERYANSMNWDDENFKKAIQLLMMEWFPRNKGEESRKLFPYIYDKKETIEMNVLWSIEERKRMQKARSIDPYLLDKFIEQSVEIDSLEKEKTKLEAQIIALKEEAFDGIIQTQKEILNMVKDLSLNELEDLKRIIQYGSLAHEIGIQALSNDGALINSGELGEKIVFSDLKNRFGESKVRWTSTFNPTNNGSGTNEYDFIVHGDDNSILYYIDAKSTTNKKNQADKTEVFWRSSEWTFIENNNKNNYLIARVFNCNSNNPEIVYLNIKKTLF